MSRSIIPDLKSYTVWFLTKSQGLYGEETLAQVAVQPRSIADAHGVAAEIPVTVQWKPVLKDSESIGRMA
ncbi:MAG: L-arabinose isomerase, partial [Candidatus Saccharibacteria bacterium]|nr:L-arabinose isomerase [Microbacteriaceae bacterium]